jgi:hypothetical protein
MFPMVLVESNSFVTAAARAASGPGHAHRAVGYALTGASSALVYLLSFAGQKRDRPSGWPRLLRSRSE